MLCNISIDNNIIVMFSIMITIVSISIIVIIIICIISIIMIGWQPLHPSPNPAATQGGLAPGIWHVSDQL